MGFCQLNVLVFERKVRYLRFSSIIFDMSRKRGQRRREKEERKRGEPNYVWGIIDLMEGGDIQYRFDGPDAVLTETYSKREALEELKGFNLRKYSKIDKIKTLRNCVEPETGLFILNCAINQGFVGKDKNNNILSQGSLF